MGFLLSPEMIVTNLVYATVMQSILFVKPFGINYNKSQLKIFTYGASVSPATFRSKIRSNNDEPKCGIDINGWYESTTFTDDDTDMFCVPIQGTLKVSLSISGGNYFPHV
jgi:hypothetical protein